MVGEKRRRKKVRTNDASWSDSSDDEMQVDQPEKTQSHDEELSELSESELSEAQVDGTEHHDDENARMLLHKAPAPQSNEDFNQYFLQMVTAEFGDDLEALRKANDFGPGSLDLLISGLKQGVNIFSEEQRKMLLSEQKN